MKRLIDADALKETINAHDYVLKDCLNTTDKGMFTVGIMQAIDEQPTIDAEPLRHGKWIWNDKCKRVCSVCENPVAFMLSKDGWHEGRYCPNCGARMDKDE